MDNLGQIIRISFFRLFFSISIGFIGILFFFIGYYDKIDVDTLVNVLKDFKSLIGDGFLFMFLILSILFLVGESLIFLGELLINELFDFNTNANINQNTGDRLERVTPAGNEYITYQNFIDFFKKTSELPTLQEVSEIHFVISRFFSGIMFIGLVGIIYFLLSLIFKVLKCENVFIFIYSIFILICICIIIHIIIVFALEIFKISVEHILLKLCILLSVLMLIVSLVLKFDIEFIEFILSITLFLLGLYVSIKYRTFANLIIWSATKNESLRSILRDILKNKN